ncbi:cytidylate kinase [Blautia sp. An249]|uniref:(d)CMP kinase n=1 Tax=Blautia sp. An249 TaxID=1965603 RepID=UPI000B37ACF8|nr:(d)CMP kinase [Blautia sp. An249]OUO80296.1 cytidylate kinase [Blautia sp. An249]
MGMNIAIDGPAGAGKSTIARKVAEKLSFLYVDTGAMYRAIAVYFLRNGLDPEKEEDVKQVCEKADISIAYKEKEQRIYLNQEDITGLLRTEETGKMASLSSAHPLVREKLLETQRELARKNSVVMDGRDIGTKVLPEAEVKIYLTASVHTRALRRYQELKEKGIDCQLSEIEKDIEDRDYRDMNRPVSPLRQAEDAVLVDSSEMTIPQVLDKILEICKEKVG